jgi:hypothetical protein
LTKALIEVLHQGGPALSVVAAWALGRIGDAEALPILREGLDAEYRSVRAHCARSLGSMGDPKAIPLLLERLSLEEDEELRVAFASALGALGAQQATTDLLELLYHSQSEDGRLELALALARLIGNEHNFIHLWRGMQTEPGTVASQAMTTAKKRIAHIVDDPGLMDAMENCAETLARGDLEHCAASIGAILPMLPLHEAGETVAQVLTECALRLDEFKMVRREYLLLALHAMDEGWQK